MFRFDFAGQQSVFSVYSRSPHVLGPFGLRAGVSTLKDVPRGTGYGKPKTIASVGGSSLGLTETQNLCGRGGGPLSTSVVCTLVSDDGGRMRLWFCDLPGGAELAPQGDIAEQWGEAVLYEIRRYKGLAAR